MKMDIRKISLIPVLGAIVFYTGCAGMSGGLSGTAGYPGVGSVNFSLRGGGSALPPPAGYKSWSAFNANDGGTNPFGSYLDGLGLPAPTGYASWNDYGNDNNIVNGSSFNFDTVPAPTGYSDWDSFNSDPSTPPPSGYATWQDWAMSLVS